MVYVVDNFSNGGGEDDAARGFTIIDQTVLALNNRSAIARCVIFCIVRKV